MHILTLTLAPHSSGGCKPNTCPLWIRNGDDPPIVLWDDLCVNMSKENISLERRRAEQGLLPQQVKDDRYNMLAEIDNEHGAPRAHEVPSLAVLAVRELHRQGHECAEGTADPAEVAEKLMAMGHV